MKINTKIWIDAIEFNKFGGWKEDTQFTHLNGSGYLIAANEPGIPVDDAVTTVDIPHKDTYRIWVRDRNWLRPHNPGTFTLLVNGVGNGVVLGQQPSDAWVWEIAGDFELDKTTVLTTRDLSGYFGRFSSILITNDFDYVPPREIDRMHTERAKIKGLPTEISNGGEYDVIVAGGGPGGVPAALASARKGIKTLLIQNRPMLGGNGSIENGITFDGAAVYTPFARESGIAEEIRRLRDSDPGSRGDWTRALEKLVAEEANLTIAYNSHVCDTQMKDDQTIRSVTALNIRELTKTQYTGKVFIDCTGDAWLGYFAGAKYRFGREPQSQHNESLAPEIADTLTMSGCIHGDKLKFFTETEEDVAFTAPDWVPKLPITDAEFGRVITGNGARMSWWLEASNTYDDMWDGEQARDALMLVHLGYYDHLKNHWSKKERAKKCKFHFATIADGRRESRRLIGDYIFTQNDALNGSRFDDAISYSGWTLDIHHPEGIYSGAKGPLYCAVRVNQPQIPFRCLYSKNINNLLFAGRNISVTHIALGTVRVQNTIATLGQAVGTAAAMCVKMNITPRDIYREHIYTLQQQLIKDDQFIPGLKNEDPTDPCLGAEATASSESNTEIFRNEHGVVGALLPLDNARITRFGISRKHGDIHHIYCKLHSSLSKPTTVTMHVRTMGGDVDSFAKLGDILTVNAIVPPQSESWIEFPIHIPVEADPYVERFSMLLWLDPADGISWRSLEKLSYHTASGIMTADGRKIMDAGWGYCICVDEPVEILANCSAENVTNGYSRIIDANLYEWVSDPKQELPQWLMLTFKQPAVINTVSVVFDTDLTNPGTCIGEKMPGVPVCVKDYSVEIFDGIQWNTVAEVQGNFMRKQTHCFTKITTQKIRINVNSTWGDRSARITEVRAGLET